MPTCPVCSHCFPFRYYFKYCPSDSALVTRCSNCYTKISVYPPLWPAITLVLFLILASFVIKKIFMPPPVEFYLITLLLIIISYYGGLLLSFKYFTRIKIEP